MSELVELDVLHAPPAPALPAAAVARLPRGELGVPELDKKSVLAPRRRVSRRLPQTRDALEAWLKERAKRVDVGDPALFVGPQGRRLSARAVDLVIRNMARRAGLRLSAHVLRHTCVTNLVRGGNDIVLVAELAGHRRLETTRRYSLPSGRSCARLRSGTCASSTRCWAVLLSARGRRAPARATGGW